MKYSFIIEETVTQSFELEANNEEELLDNIEQKYRNSELVLEPGELIETKVGIISPKQNNIKYVKI